MTSEEILKSTIKSKYTSVRAFAKECDIPYSTLTSILDRGIATAGVGSMVRICQALDISLEELVLPHNDTKFGKLKGKTVILGVTGGIAVYKTPNLVSMLKKAGADVYVIMTKNAQEFITPLPFETLTGRNCIVDTFSHNFSMEVEHVSLSKKADIVLIAPCTANVIGKIANGIADDMLTTTIMACTCPVLISPAMNTKMYENKIVQKNIQQLKSNGYKIIDTESGFLACGDNGAGRMPEPETLYEYIEKEIACRKDLAGKKVLITAGPTQEAIDPVRFITNHSSGKMGYALAKAAMLRGADVTLISGQVSLKQQPFVKTIYIKSAKDMADAVKENMDADIIIKAAAVADYTPVTVANNKIKKSGSDLKIEVTRTEDILQYLGSHKRDDQIIVGFSMETENLIENSTAKLKKKNVDMIVANSINQSGAGFGVDTNVVTLITKNDAHQLPQMSKDEVSHQIIDKILTL